MPKIDSNQIKRTYYNPVRVQYNRAMRDCVSSEIRLIKCAKYVLKSSVFLIFKCKTF